MLTEEKSRTVVIARKMQGRNPRQTLPGIQESFGGGRPNMYLAHRLISWIIVLLLPNRAQLGYQKGQEESGNGGKEQGTWEGAEVRHP